MKSHLDYIKLGEKPLYPICVPSHRDPSTGHTFKHLKNANIKYAYIHIDDTDNVEEYQKLPYNVCVKPKRTIAEKRFDMVEFHASLGHDWCWFIDDDYLKFVTKDMNNKLMELNIGEFFATAEQFIDIEKDWFCKFPVPGFLRFFGKGKKYEWTEDTIPYMTSSKTNWAGCYGINIKLMTKHGINFDRACPHGCGEDTEIICHFIKKGLKGKTIKIISAEYDDDKSKSVCWPEDKIQRQKDVYIYLKNKYPDLIYWDNGKGKNPGRAVFNKTDTEYPEWYTKDNTFKFGSIK